MPNISWDPKITFGNALTVLTIVVGGLGAFFALQGSVSASSEKIATLQQQVQPIDDLKTRMVVVERNQQTGKEQREAFQVEAKQTLELLRQQNLTILNSLSAITARLDAQDRANR